MEDAEEEEEGMHYMDEDAEEEGYGMEEMGSYLDDDAMYEIDEMELAEALVTMRQQRLEESAVRDAVRDEIKRALSDKSGSWIYGSNKPAASRPGQIARGGFGFGFKR
jgi:non-homologous end joining protein Ku